MEEEELEYAEGQGELLVLLMELEVTHGTAGKAGC
jgi:hypothetical protein